MADNGLVKIGYNFTVIVEEMGGSIYQLKGRERVRMMVRIRDGFTCRSCGKKRTIREVARHNARIIGNKGKIKLFDVHHINGQCGKNSRGYDRIDSTDGLITLCHKCHYNHHEFSKKKEWKEAAVAKKKVLKERGVPFFTMPTDRNVAIKDAHFSGKSLTQVGHEFGITRERVRQIIVGFGEKTKRFHVKKEKPPKPAYTFTCLCGKEVVTTHPKRVYCSPKCPVVVAKRKEYTRKLAKELNERIKDEPWFKELTRRRNNGEKGLSYKDFINK